MDQLDSMNRLLEAQLREIERQLKFVEREKDPFVVKSKLLLLGREMQSLGHQLDLLDMQLITATDTQRAIFMAKLQQHNEQKQAFVQKLAQLNAQGEGSPPTVILDKPPVAGDGEGTERQALVDDVNRRLQAADADLDEIINELGRGKNIMNEVAVELRRQQERMAKALTDIKDTYSLAKRSKALLRYFQRAMMTDKLLITLVILVTLALIVVIVLKGIGFKTPALAGWTATLPNQPTSTP